jgi:hypothetical protein
MDKLAETVSLHYDRSQQKINVSVLVLWGLHFYLYSLEKTLNFHCKDKGNFYKYIILKGNEYLIDIFSVAL